MTRLTGVYSGSVKWESCFLVGLSWVISLHNGNIFTLTVTIGLWASKEESHNKICAYVSYKEPWMLWQVQLCHYTRGPFRVGEEGFGMMFLFCCSELWANWSIFPDPLSQAAFIPHKAQIPQRKWDGRSSNDRLSFMFGEIKNDFLNATPYALLYCKSSVNLMCSFWHDTFIFHLGLKSWSDLLLQWDLGCFVMWVSYYYFSFPYLRHHKQYLP